MESLPSEEEEERQRPVHPPVAVPDPEPGRFQADCTLERKTSYVGGGPKKRSRQGKAKDIETPRSSYSIEDGIDLNACLEFDILKGNEKFKGPVFDQKKHDTCGPISISDNIGMSYGIQNQTHYLETSAQELLSWLQFHEPYYYLSKKAKERMNEQKEGYSFGVGLPDPFYYVQENGVHLNLNYPYEEACNIKFPQDIKNYEVMRSTFKDGQPEERYWIDGFEYLVVDDKREDSENKDTINKVKAALQKNIPVNGLLWASAEFAKFQEKGIFDQDITLAPNHIVLIVGYGDYQGIEFFKIKNSYGTTWGDGGYGFVAVRQFKSFAYIEGEIYSMGGKPPERILVFYTTKKTETLAKNFAKRSNKRYTTVSPNNSRHADFRFIPNDLDSYATSMQEFTVKFKKETLALFLLDNVEDDEKYLKPFYNLLKKEAKLILSNIQYAVFGLHSIAGKTDTGLESLGARRMTDMVIDDKVTDVTDASFTSWEE